MRCAILGVLSLFLFACSAKPVGEFGAACKNGIDDDSDGLTDCDDPDCFNQESCRAANAHPMPRMDGGMDAGHPPPKPDASTPPYDAGTKHDAATLPEASLPELDAGEDEDGSIRVPDASVPACSPPCNASEECVGSATSLHCEAVSASSSGLFSLSILDANVPNLNPMGFCVDCPSFLFYCNTTEPDCLVDPYVRARLTHNGMTTTILSTNFQANIDTPTFADPSATGTVTIDSGDVLTLEAWDHDLTRPASDVSADVLLFSCKPPLGDLSAQPMNPISCGRFVLGSAGVPEFVSIDAELDKM